MAGVTQVLWIAASTQVYFHVTQSSLKSQDILWSLLGVTLWKASTLVVCAYLSLYATKFLSLYIKMKLNNYTKLILH